MQALESELDIMAALKARTAEHHSSLESALPIFAESQSIESYTRVLRIFLGFYEPVETMLAAILDPHKIELNMSERRRAGLLRVDLLALGLLPAEIDLIPRSKDLPTLKTVDEGLGTLYVLEGSTLGGQVIAREVEQRFGIGKEQGAAFFHGYGSRTGRMWLDLCSSIREYASHDGNTDAMVNAARSTFQSLESWIRKAEIDGK